MAVAFLLICAMLVCTRTFGAPFFDLFDFFDYDSSSEEEKKEPKVQVYIANNVEKRPKEEKKILIPVPVGPIKVDFPNITVNLAPLKGNFNISVNATAINKNEENIVINNKDLQTELIKLIEAGIKKLNPGR
ncbi:uncharacterized protein LOC123006618 [Tribolium madens]|uniref:uncharacterized protein LOC123006618 n=1 Tax=Tribolium madens TaxID=41895 RepID=UPI001CF72BFE|nr:uncharacterized protein LOC123006618 [Tribolium madens]